MLNKIKRKVFNKLGIGPNKKKQAHIKKLLASPLDSSLHLDLAKFYFNNKDFFAAWAELKTAEYLGLDESIVKANIPVFKAKLPTLTNLGHNLYFRLKTLSDEIYKHQPETVLDVGGGDGVLSSFIPDLKYCLVEPKKNGINGLKIPFPDASFDLVVSCHVLEHIPLEERETFLDQLVAKSKKGVVLLNPILIEETLPQRRLELIIDVTNAAWAHEHLECTLPTVDSIKKYADSRSLKFHYAPNGTMTTSLALVFFDHSRKQGKANQYQKVNQFLNTEYINILNSEKYPTAGLFYLEKTS